MFKRNFLLLSLFLTNFLQVFSWSVTVHNNSDQAVMPILKTTQYYPNSKFQQVLCSVGNYLDPNKSPYYPDDIPYATIQPGQTKTLDYTTPRGNRNMGADAHVCVGACTNYLGIMVNGQVVVDISKLVGGLGACSDVEVWVGKGSDGQWYMYKKDWTDAFMDWVNKQIVPGLEQAVAKFTGLNLPDILQKAPDTQNIANSIGGKINNLQNNLKTQTTLVNNITKQINDFVNNQIQNVSKQTGLSPAQLKSELTPFNQTTIGNFIKKHNLSISLDDLIDPYQAILNLIKATDFRPTLLSAKDLLDIGQHLISNVAALVNDIPSGMLAHDIVSPLQKLAQHLGQLSGNLDILSKAPTPNIDDVWGGDLIAALMDTSKVGPAMQKVSTEVNSIINDLNKITGTIVPQFGPSVKKVTDIMSNIKDRLMDQLKSPQNAPLLTGAVLAALPASFFAAITFGLAAPYALEAVSKAATPLIHNIITGLMKQTDIGTLISNVKDLMNNVADMADHAVNAINVFKTDLGVPLFTDAESKIISDMNGTLKQIAGDITALNNAIPSLTGGTPSSQKNNDISPFPPTAGGQGPTAPGYYVICHPPAVYNGHGCACPANTNPTKDNPAPNDNLNQPGRKVDVWTCK